MNPQLSLKPEERAERDALLRRFTLAFAAGVTALALIPTLVAWLIAPPGATYIGSVFNTDDHMVYAAWVGQAAEGRFFLSNRFTTDAQPEMTVHLYFWLLGQFARFTGVIEAMLVGRVVGCAAFVFALGALLRRTQWDLFTCKLAMALVTFGGGMGFLVWHNFGRLLEIPSSRLFAPLLGGWQPIDVWQPEAFVFPSMLTNGLFMVSLSLMLVVLTAVLDARESWRPVLPGALAFGVLMNIHSYDVLILALALVGLLVASAVRKDLPLSWLGRVLTMSCGILPAALWFLHVLRHDPVFQSRAATPTFAADFPAMLGGVIFVWVAALIGLVLSVPSRARGWAGAGLWFALGAGLWVAARAPGDAYALSPVAFVAALGAALAIVALGADDDPAWNTFLAWGATGMVAPYFPALFQRKLAAGVVIPLALLAACGLALLLRRKDRHQRNLGVIFFILLLGGSSMLWFQRELHLARTNVSTTTLHPAYLSPDVQEIVRIVRRDRAPRRVVLAFPGSPSPTEAPDRFSTPFVPDLNGLLTGLAGATTYAGHWSETPDYATRLRTMTRRLFFSHDPADQRAFLEEVGARYVVTLNPAAYPQATFADVTGNGRVVFRGRQFVLVQLGD